MTKIILGKHFEQDTNRWLQTIQDQTFSGFLQFLFDETKSRVHYAHRLLGESSVLVTDFDLITGVDRRVFADLYNIIALHYRIDHSAIVNLSAENFNRDFSEQVHLWTAWYVQILRDIFENAHLCRQFALMFTYQNQPQGDQAEHEIARQLVSRFQFFDRCPSSYFCTSYP